MASNASRNRCARGLVDLPDRLAGRRDRVDEVLALRRSGSRGATSSSSNCSMAIMLTGPSRSIFRFSSSMASSGVSGARRRLAPAPRPRSARRPPRLAGAGLGGRRLGRRGVLVRLLGVDGPPVGADVAVALHLLDLGDDRVAARTTACRAQVASRCARSLSGLRARDLGLGSGPRGSRRARAGPRGWRPRRRRSARAARSIASSTRRTSSRARSSAATSASSARRASATACSQPRLLGRRSAAARPARAARRASISRCASSALAASSASGRGPLEQAGVLGHGVADAVAADPRVLARLEQAPLRRGEPLVDGALVLGQAGDRRPRVGLPQRRARRSPPRPGGRRAPPVPASAAIRAMVVVGLRDAQLEADDGHLLAVDLRRHATRWPPTPSASAVLDVGGGLDQPRHGRPLRRRAARAGRACRAWCCRMPRLSSRPDPPSTMRGPVADVAVGRDDGRGRQGGGRDRGRVRRRQPRPRDERPERVGVRAR